MTPLGGSVLTDEHLRLVRNSSSFLHFSFIALTAVLNNVFDDYLSSVWLPCWCVKYEKKKRRPDSSYHLPAERLLRSGRSVFFDEERAVYNCKLHRSCSHDDIFFMTEGFCTQISLMNNRVKQFSRFLYCRISPSL